MGWIFLLLQSINWINSATPGLIFHMHWDEDILFFAVFLNALRFHRRTNIEIIYFLTLMLGDMLHD